MTDPQRPILLDLFCCEGGASRGYDQAGFDVVGVDLVRKRRYPYPFLQADALDVLRVLLDGGAVEFSDGRALQLQDVAAIHASPPCQGYSITRHSHSREYPLLVEPVRDLLQQTGLPWVIENVKGAPLVDPLVLCWSMFHQPGSVLDDDGTPLTMQRHRLFESNVQLQAPAKCNHAAGVQVAGSYGGARRDKVEAREIRHGGYVPSRAVQQQLLGIDWMTNKGMYESLPPVYTRHVGAQLLSGSAAQSLI